MTFLQPLLLWALPLAALPIAVHLLNLRRHRKVEWGAMQFLLLARQQKRGHTRLRHLLILLSRVIAVATLILLVSRPMTGRWFGLFSGKPETVIILLDRSPSMAQEDIQTNISKRSMAVQQLATAIQRTGQPNDLVLIDSSGKPPTPIASAEVLLEIPETVTLDASASLPTMLQDALAYIVANQSGRTDIWICSDLQAVDWDPANAQWKTLRASFTELAQPVRFHLLTYPRPPTDNLSVRVQNLRRQQQGDHDQLVMDIQLRRAVVDGNPLEDRDVRLEVVVDDARTVIDTKILGDSLVLENHPVPLDRQRKSGWGKVELPIDINPRDNVFFFTYGDHLARRTVIVSDEPGSTWPLRLAAAPPSQTDTRAEVIGSSLVDTIPWHETSLILWQSRLPTDATLSNLIRFVDAGGQVMFFPPTEQDGESRDEVWAHRWSTWQRLPAAALGEESQAIIQWRDDRGLLAHSDAGEPLPVSRVNVFDYCRLEGPGQVMARLKTGDPLLVQAATDRGGVYFCATLPQLPYSDLAQQGVAFFAMIQRALAAGAEHVLASQFGEIQLATESINLVDVAAWQWVNGWPEGRLSTEKRNVAGVYQVNDQLIARNRPAAEDQPGRLVNSQLDQLFGELNFRIVQDSVVGERSLVTEIWRLFAFGLLLALILESALCVSDVRPKTLVPA